ncbi:MAG TPA: response regulator [Aggregatilineales bacterium]|nr:response regulator [Aggregatilineales bacterium]
MAHILVVDDEPDVRELFNITLKMAGHQTDTARDGLEAVGKLADRWPDLILLDLMMPRMDGFAFLSHVREKAVDQPMRVLVATAKLLNDADKQRLTAWPVVGVLNKGELDIARMVGVVSTALNQSAKPAAAPEAMPPAAKNGGEPKDAAPAAPPAAPLTAPQSGPPASPKAAPGSEPGKLPATRPLGQPRADEPKPPPKNASGRKPGGWLLSQKLR